MGYKHQIFIITQHCFAAYRLPIFQRLLAGHAGMEGRLLFGLNPARDNVKTFTKVEDIPPFEGVNSSQYILLKNHWLIGPVLWQSGVLKETFRREVKVVVLEGSPYILNNWVAMLLLRLFTRKRVLIWTIGIMALPHGFKGWLTRLFWRLPHGMLLYGHWARKNLIERFGHNPDNLYVIFNSLDFEQQLKLRQILSQDILTQQRQQLFGERWKTPILLHIGRLNHDKKLELLITAVNILQKRGVSVNVLFVGSGDAVEKLQHQVQELDLEGQVNFYGACYDENITARLIACADVGVAPSDLGLMSMHCLMYGTPVITHDFVEDQAPESESIIPGLTGALFRYDDVNSLADTIQSWLETAHDREAVRRACFEMIEKYYNPDTQVKIFQAALEGRPASACLLGEGPYVVR